MKRRRLLQSTLVVVGVLVPSILAAQRQPEATKKIWRIGFLSPYSAEHDKAWRAGFREGMRELGYIEGGNLAIEMRHAVGATDRLTAFARELVNLKIDLLLVHGSLGSQAANRQATRYQSSSSRIRIR